MISKGIIKKINGLVLKIEFQGDPLPTTWDILSVERDPSIKLQALNGGYNIFAINLTNKIIKNNDVVINSGQSPKIGVGTEIVGRALNALGQPIDKKGEINYQKTLDIYNFPQLTINTNTKNQILETGIRVIDFFLPIKFGSKVGIFGGGGVGKTILLTEIMNNILNSVDKNSLAVFAGIGERKREAIELYKLLEEKNLLRNITLIFSTMSENPAIRLIAAHTSATIAEYFRDYLKKNVLFFLDNMFRFAQAGYEIATLTENIPSQGGYQPNLTSQLSSFHERLINSENSWITTFETVYLPSDDYNDILVQEISTHTDVEIFLSREIYQAGLFPAIDILNSSSSFITDNYLSKEHYKTLIKAREILKQAHTLNRIVSFVGEDELSDTDRTIFHRSELLKAYMTQPFFTLENQTTYKGVHANLQDTIKDVQKIIDGQLDSLNPKKLLFVKTIKI